MILEKFSGAVRIINDFIDDFSAVRKNRLNALDISHLTEEYDNILQSKKLIDSLHEEVKEKIYWSLYGLIEQTWRDSFGRAPICFKIHVSGGCDSIMHCDPYCKKKGKTHSSVLIFSCEPLNQKALEVLKDLESRTGFEFDLSLIEKKIKNG